MSEDIDNIVQVTITRQTTTPAEESFSGILIAAEFLKATPNPDFGTSERVRTYGSLSEVLNGGFGTSSFVYKAAAAIFSQNPAPNLIYVGRKLTGGDGTEDWPTALTAMLAYNNLWYGIVASTRTLADQEDIADWTEANDKFYIAGSGDGNYVNDDGDIAEYMQTNALDRSASIYHPDVGGGSEPVPEAAWMGKMFGKQPGSATWAYKTLAGISVYALTSAQATTALDKNGNIYTRVAGVNITREGKVGSGEWIDVITGIDWLTARIHTKVFTPLVAQDKVPFTDAGIQTINTQLKSALQDGVNAGLLASFETTVPKVADVSSGDKGTRTLPDVKFRAVLQGAIHKTVIEGVISL